MKVRSLKNTVGVIVLMALSTSCNYHDMSDDGVLDETFIHKYGVAVPRDFWSLSGEDGTVVSTMANGVIVTKKYASGILHGSTTYTFPQSSQIEKEEIYYHGILVKEIDYFPDSTPEKEIVYDRIPDASKEFEPAPPQDPDSSDLTSAQPHTPTKELKTISSWYFGGTPRSVEQYIGDQLLTGEYYTLSNQHDSSVENFAGVRLVRDEHGQLISRDNIENGQLVLKTAFYPNGTPKEKTPYKDGVVNGTKQTFYSAGDPDTVEEWVMGQQQGLTVIYQHGEKTAEVPYVNGSKNGVEKRYRDGVELIQEISWKNDQLHGPSITHIGNATKTEWYYLGEPKSKVEYDFLMNKRYAMP